MGVPKMVGFIRENPMNDLGVPPFMETPTCFFLCLKTFSVGGQVPLLEWYLFRSVQYILKFHDAKKALNQIFTDLD